MSDPRPVNLSRGGPPETVLDPEPPAACDALEAAMRLDPDERRDAVADVVARWPRMLDAWARLGEVARDPVEQYAAYRVGYHRGLDRLRANGWRGSGSVRWRYAENRGFLRSLAGLQQAAESIGEHDEAERCRHFLHQIDPDWPPTES
jgi:hypothetical protein